MNHLRVGYMGTSMRETMEVFWVTFDDDVNTSIE
jgi:hypothetical protein